MGFGYGTQTDTAEAVALIRHADDLGRIEEGAVRIEAHGARYPERFQKMIDR